MAKNFDDFAMRIRDDKYFAERLFVISKQATNRIENGADGLSATLEMFEDFLVEYLRAYHDWVNE